MAACPRGRVAAWPRARVPACPRARIDHSDGPPHPSLRRARRSGKTSLLTRFTEGRFIEASATVSVDVSKAELDLGAQNVNLQLFDTAGQARHA